MALEFNIEENKLLLKYSPENGVAWIDEILDSENEFYLKRTFAFKKTDLYTYDKTNDDERIFVLGELDHEFYKISNRILSTTFDVLIHYSVEIKKDTFISNNSFSIFKRFDKLANQQIVIGGNESNSIPENIFIDIINSLPNKTELEHYVNSRITNVLSQYLEKVKDSGNAFEKYLEKRTKFKNVDSLKSIKINEVEKYSFILKKLKDMLENSTGFSESNWQSEILEIILLLYPKYIRCFSEVHINDYYTNPQRTTKRKVDLMLVDTNGNIDLIEIKKPFEFSVISQNTYRANYTPMKELSGTIMQVEKYLFHLNKWGCDGERKLTSVYQSQLPNSISIRITNPKGILIIGRDYNLNESQKFDFEIIKRKYSNIMDIITYDDLIKRLENILEVFRMN